MHISLSKYLINDSIIHRLDARIKLLANIIFIILFFLANNFFIQLILLTPLIIAFIISTKRPLYLLKMLIMPIIIGIFLLLINMFVFEPVSNNNTLNWQFENWIDWYGILKLNYAILITTIAIVIRIYGIILTTTLLTLSTQPILITKALDFYFYPLKLIGVPIHVFTMIISIAFRFIPTLVDEATRIFKAQASRGVDFKNGSLKTKAKSLIVLIIPLFVSSFTKADDLSNAMESRGYNPYEKRTSYRKWTLSWFDILSLIFIISFVILMFLMILQQNIFNFPDWWNNAKCSF